VSDKNSSDQLADFESLALFLFVSGQAALRCKVGLPCSFR
jgi:hypothetical protein